MFEVKESNYDDYIKYNGERMINTPYGKSINNGELKYFVILKDGKFYTDFSIDENNNNEINLNIIIKLRDVFKTLIDYCMNNYSNIKLRTLYDEKLNIEKNYNVIRKKVIDDEFNIIDYYIKF